MYQKQVDRSHYEFSAYIDKRRWMSTWYQVDEVLRLRPKKILEVGPGPGLFKAVATAVGLCVETLDVDPALNPDHVGSIIDMPFGDGTYNLVCAFQVLEHIPFEQSLKALKEMVRVASDKVVISLPDAKKVWRFVLHVPLLGDWQFLLPIPLWRKRHCFDGEHYWEINKRGYSLPELTRTFFSAAGVSVMKTYRIKENPYHRFFVLKQGRSEALERKANIAEATAK